LVVVTFPLDTLAFAILYALRARWLEAAIAASIGLNALIVFETALASFIRGEHGVGVLRLYRDKATMAEVRSSNPQLLEDTMLIAVAVLVPLGLTLLVAKDKASRPRR
jgi:hypothetical protein